MVEPFISFIFMICKNKHHPTVLRRGGSAQPGRNGGSRKDQMTSYLAQVRGRGGNRAREVFSRCRLLDVNVIVKSFSLIF